MVVVKSEFPARPHNFDLGHEPYQLGRLTLLNPKAGHAGHYIRQIVPFSGSNSVSDFPAQSLFDLTDKFLLGFHKGKGFHTSAIFPKIGQGPGKCPVLAISRPGLVLVFPERAPTIILSINRPPERSNP